MTSEPYCCSIMGLGLFGLAGVAFCIGFVSAVVGPVSRIYSGRVDGF